jgi:glycosyltransferase involved in cell wall biosynthesis
LRILSVGRAVEKKGFPDLIHALAKLGRDPDWEWVHVGGGPDLAALKSLVQSVGIDGRVRWRGSLSQPEVIEEYRAADLFVLPSRVAASGDRDGLPNVLLEAQSQGLACISTRVSGIPELIDDGCNGVLLESGDVTGLARAIGQLLDDPGERRRLGERGRARVVERFSSSAGIGTLRALLEDALRR